GLRRLVRILEARLSLCRSPRRPTASPEPLTASWAAKIGPSKWSMVRANRNLRVHRTLREPRRGCRKGKKEMLRKFSLICAIAAALFFPLPAFAGHGGHGHGGHGWHGGHGGHGWHGGHWHGGHGHWHGGHLGGGWGGWGGPSIVINIGRRYPYYGYGYYPYHRYGYYPYYRRSYYGYGYYPYYRHHHYRYYGHRYRHYGHHYRHWRHVRHHRHW